MSLLVFGLYGCVVYLRIMENWGLAWGGREESALHGDTPLPLVSDHPLCYRTLAQSQRPLPTLIPFLSSSSSGWEQLEVFSLVLKRTNPFTHTLLLSI